MANETKLVTLPKEVAEAIDILRSGIEPLNDYAIITFIDDEDFYDDFPPLKTLNEYFDSSTVHSDRHPCRLMFALVNGYRVEANPEDKVREYYDEMYCIASNEDPGSRQYEAECKTDAIKKTLSILGIHIAGINA